MSSIMGEKLRVSLFGQSHGEAVGVVLDGLPAGEKLDFEQIRQFLWRRVPGKNDLSTSRREADEPKILSGLLDAYTCGAPLCAIMENNDIRPGDYTKQGDLPRPAHADFPAQMRHQGYQDVRGGGHHSGRLTAPLCFAGAVALQLLEKRSVFVGAHAERIGTASDRRFSPVTLTRQELHFPAQQDFPALEKSAAQAMRDEIRAAAEAGDSIGGIVECAAIGMPPGVGNPLFDGVENRLAAALFAIPAVRGVEFGNGFEAAGLRGSENNDVYCVKNGEIHTKSNRHGGVLGGMTTGMPLLLRVAFKPTPSVAQPQTTVDMRTLQEQTLQIQGRHDPCIVPRAVPCVEAAVALVLLDFLL